MKTSSRSVCASPGAVLTALALSLALCLPVAADPGAGLWLSAGQNRDNTRHQATETAIGLDNVENLVTKWVVTTGGDVSATPAVDGGSVYFPDYAGNLYKLDRETGAVVWQRTFAELTGIPGNYARTTPAVAGNLLIMGDQGGALFTSARVMAINKNTGDLVWMTQLDDHPAAIVTQSATVFGNTVFVGASSLEELFAAVIPGYECCSFRGFLAALDKNTGAILWKTYTTAEGFSGNGVWGSSPAVDPKRGQVYIATGNNYSAPESFLDCIEAAGDDTDAQRACLDPYPTNYFDSIVAFDMETGAVNWTTTVIPFDVWTVECLFGLPGCPDPEGPNFDFGQAPLIYTAGTGADKADRLGVGQKSGIFWSLDPDSGAVVWSTRVSPGGVVGGLQWGSASDGVRLYTSSANSEYKPWVLPDGTTTTAGIWSALDPLTGEVLWQTANPTGFNAGGAVTVANGVVYVGSQDPAGHMYALDAATGTIEWDFVSGGSCNAGAAVVNGSVFWGSGYGVLGSPNTFNNQFYAFELP